MRSNVRVAPNLFKWVPAISFHTGSPTKGHGLVHLGSDISAIRHVQQRRESHAEAHGEEGTCRQLRVPWAPRIEFHGEVSLRQLAVQ